MATCVLTHANTSSPTRSCDFPEEIHTVGCGIVSHEKISSLPGYGLSEMGTTVMVSKRPKWQIWRKTYANQEAICLFVCFCNEDSP